MLHTLLHLNLYLGPFLNHYGFYAYAFLFLIIFLETGLVITPFLPGDSLLFSLGALLASDHQGPIKLFGLICLLILAAFLGDNLNYWLGRLLGPRIFHDQNNQNKNKWLSHKHLERTHQFYQKYGTRTLILARFIPIIRTFAPFVAGIGQMAYPKFLMISFIAAVFWIGLVTGLGYFFGNLSWVQHYFSVVILAVIFISLLPIVIQVSMDLLHRDSK